MKTLTNERYELIQRAIDRLKAMYPRAEDDLSQLSDLFWVFAQPLEDVNA